MALAFKHLCDNSNAIQLLDRYESRITRDLRSCWAERAEAVLPNEAIEEEPAMEPTTSEPPQAPADPESQPEPVENDWTVPDVLRPPDRAPSLATHPSPLATAYERKAVLPNEPIEEQPTMEPITSEPPQPAADPQSEPEPVENDWTVPNVLRPPDRAGSLATRPSSLATTYERNAVLPNEPIEEQPALDAATSEQPEPVENDWTVPNVLWPPDGRRHSSLASRPSSLATAYERN